MTLKHAIFAALPALLLLSAAHAATLKGTCVAVSDGDTVTVLDPVRGEKEKVRIWGIDAPEDAQEYGAEARQKLTSLVRGKQVRVEYDKRDSYHRILGRVYVGEVYVNLEMVKSGSAWHYVYFAPEAEDIRRAESDARAAKRGLWAGGSPVAPWVYRHPNLSVTPNSGETVQYWVSATGKIHRAGCRFYKKGTGQLSPNPRGVNCKICKGKP